MLEADLVHQHLAGDGLPFGQPQQVVAFRIADEIIGQELAAGEDREQNRHRFDVATGQSRPFVAPYAAAADPELWDPAA